MFTIGFDIGSSAVKASLFDVAKGETVASGTFPETEMKIDAPQPGWAEQNPADWWENIKAVSAILKKKNPEVMKQVKAVGITYQMHGLVLVDDKAEVLRPSIIWCDSRAAKIGDKAFKELGEQQCLADLLNSPGNFTAAKLRWVQENEPDIFSRIHKMMLPGDYVAMKLTGEIQTTTSGLSEGILWNFQKSDIARELLAHWDIDTSLLPPLTDTFSEQASVTAKASEELGIPAGIPVTYRAGDQPNNAFSLNVLHPGELAATAGTSGVVYGVMDTPAHDVKSRVNTFVHVNNTTEKPRYGVLLCVNGTGILNSWMKNTLLGDSGRSYEGMNKLAAQITPGADGVMVFPFGNGAERVLENQEPGAMIKGVSFNSHDQRHVLRAAQEGIVYALAYGMEIMKDMGMKMDSVKAGQANMFLSPVFREVFINTTGAELKLYDTDGAQGAARGAAAGAGLYNSVDEAFSNLKVLEHQQPDANLQKQYEDSYGKWKDYLKKILN